MDASPVRRSLPTGTGGRIPSSVRLSPIVTTGRVPGSFTGARGDGFDDGAKVLSSAIYLAIAGPFPPRWGRDSSAICGSKRGSRSELETRWVREVGRSAGAEGSNPRPSPCGGGPASANARPEAAVTTTRGMERKVAGSPVRLRGPRTRHEVRRFTQRSYGESDFCPLRKPDERSQPWRERRPKRRARRTRWSAE
jgi:hypothetical protein